MTTFIKGKLKLKSDEQTNIDKYREPANITEYYIKISQVIKNLKKKNNTKVLVLNKEILDYCT